MVYCTSIGTKATVIGCCLILFGTTTCIAEPSARYSLRGSETIAALGSDMISQTGHHKTNRYVALQQRPHLWLRLPRFGRVRVSLNWERFLSHINNTSSFRLFQGATLSSRRRKRTVSPASLSLLLNHDRSLTARLFLHLFPRKARDENSSGLHEFRFRIPQVQDNAVAERLALIRSKQRPLYEVSRVQATHAVSSTNRETTAARQPFVVRALIEADQEYSQRIEFPLEYELATIFNAVDLYFRRDLNIIFDPILISDPQNYTQPIALDDHRQFSIHQEMAEKREPESRDIHILLSGKTPLGRGLFFLAGAVPRIGAVCRYPARAAAFTIHWQDEAGEATSQDDIVTTAHEVGHLFGAEHDDMFTPIQHPALMNSSGNGFNPSVFDRFSRYSQAQVASFLASRGSCLNRGTPVDTDEFVATLAIKRKANHLIVAAINSIGRPVPYASVRLLCRDSEENPLEVQAEAFTNQLGRVKLPRGGKSLCLVQSGSVTIQVPD